MSEYIPLSGSADQKSLYFESDILDKVADAHSFKLSKKTRTKSRSGTTRIAEIITVVDKDFQPFNILKVFICNEKDDEEIKKIQNEIKITQALGALTPYIAKALDIRITTTGSVICYEMLLEYGGENLLTLMQEKRLADMDIVIIAMQTMHAMCLAHRDGYFHSDIKPENITYNKEKRMAKIIDFGISQDLEKGTALREVLKGLKDLFKGYTWAYLPPEMIELLSRGFTTEKFLMRNSIDVYQWGMTLYQLISKKTLEELSKEVESFKINPDNYGKFISEIQNYKGNFSYMKDFRTMITTCLDHSPVLRPTFESLAVAKMDDWLKLLPDAENVSK